MEKKGSVVDTLRRYIGTLCLQLARTIFPDAVIQSAEYLQLRERERNFQELAHLDDKTGILNSRGLRKEANRVFGEINSHKERVFAIIDLDLDEFRELNDKYGEDEVDRMFLLPVAQKMREKLRREDLLARKGGDEFVIISEVTPKELSQEESFNRKKGLAHAFIIAEKIRRLIEEEFRTEGLTGSFGIKLFSKEDIENLERPTGEKKVSEVVDRLRRQAYDARLISKRIKGKNSTSISPVDLEKLNVEFSFIRNLAEMITHSAGGEL